MKKTENNHNIAKLSTEMNKCQMCTDTHKVQDHLKAPYWIRLVKTIRKSNMI